MQKHQKKQTKKIKEFVFPHMVAIHLCIRLQLGDDHVVDMGSDVFLMALIVYKDYEVLFEVDGWLKYLDIRCRV